MKQIIFPAISIFIFCFAAFAQAIEIPCPKINIKTPKTVQPDESFKVFASFEKENQPSTSKFNWVIIEEGEVFNKVSKINDKGIIEVDSKNLRDGGMIILLAEALNKKCQDVAIAKVFVIPNVGSPLVIDEYSELNWNDERVRLDSIAVETQNRKDSKVWAFFDFNKRISQVERKSHLEKVLSHLSNRGLEKNRIIFLISEADEERIKYQIIPKKFSQLYFCDDCLVIKAEDFDKLGKLFQPKSTTQKRKK